MTSDSRPIIKGLGLLAVIGPGLAMAAFGVGAGDVTTTALGGARFGLVLVWVPLLAGILKYVLNEGLARWQLATGQTLLEGWAERMGPIVKYGFLVYLIGWTIPVFGTLISTSGLTAHQMLPLDKMVPVLGGPLFEGGPGKSPLAWSLILVVTVVLLVWFGRYSLFEKIMSIFVLAMMIIAIVSTILLFPTAARFSNSFVSGWWTDIWNDQSTLAIVFAIMGGTGSTVGVLAYSYWIRERGRHGPEWLTVTRIDLAACYVVSAVFGLCMILLAGGANDASVREALDLPADAEISKLGLDKVFELVRYRLGHETMLGESGGAWLGQLFGISLFATVLSSLLGLLQGMPYLYADFLALIKRVSQHDRKAMTQQQSRSYRVFLILLAVCPLPLVAWQRPAVIVMIYAVWGSLFMPFLAATLLIMNNRRSWVGNLRNGWLTNLVLGLCLAIFSLAFITTGIDRYRRYHASRTLEPMWSAKVLLILQKVSAKRVEDFVSFECEVRIENETGTILTVNSNFYSVFDGLALVISDQEGKTMGQVEYTSHQSPYTFEGRNFPLKEGATSRTLAFPVWDAVPQQCKTVKVRLVGTLPGSTYSRILSTETLEVQIR